MVKVVISFFWQQIGRGSGVKQWEWNTCPAQNEQTTINISDYNLDICRVGEEHGESVDAEAPPTSRRESVLQRRAEVLIDHL